MSSYVCSVFCRVYLCCRSLDVISFFATRQTYPQSIDQYVQRKSFSMFPLLISLRITQQGHRNPYKHPANICRCTRFQLPWHPPLCPFPAFLLCRSLPISALVAAPDLLWVWSQKSKRKTECHRSYVYEWISVLIADLLRSGEVHVRLVLAVNSQDSRAWT